jgi:hypothetical protein
MDHLGSRCGATGSGLIAKYPGTLYAPQILGAVKRPLLSIIIPKPKKITYDINVAHMM